MNGVIFKQLAGKDVDAMEDKLRAMISEDFYLLWKRVDCLLRNIW